jgi:hypothetical protein
MRRVFFVLVVLLSLAGRADALTLRDIVELNRSGLGEEVLLALIEVNQQIFAIDNDTILGLREAGLSEKVIVAIIRSGRTNQQPRPLQLEADPAPAPQPVHAAAPPITVEQSNNQTQTVQVAAPSFPVFVPVAVRPAHRFDRFDRVDTFEPFRLRDHLHDPPRQPVFWGWGGKQRPDSWSLDGKPVTKAAASGPVKR